MKKKTSADYQREYRKRLRDQGLIKREVWILPEHNGLLAIAEKHLRVKDASEFSTLIDARGGVAMTSTMMGNSAIWTTPVLFKALHDSVLCASGSATIEMIDGVEPTIQMTMLEHGDLPLFLTVSGEQIIAEAILWPATDIANVIDFNEFVLRTHKYFPLSTISLDKMNDGQDYYHMFGALSSASSLENIVFEIEVLASNVIQATSAYKHFLKGAIEA